MTNNTALFVSDVHLSESNPELTTLFLTFLNGIALEYKQIYILGDLFNIWLGDDVISPLSKALIHTFQSLTQRGVQIYFMAGNRDYLLGKQFAKQTGITLLPDPTLITLNGKATLLTHGDKLVTGDKAYQRYRAIAQHPIILYLFPKLPLIFRQKFAEYLRRKSKEYTKKKSEKIMDVNADTVKEWMEKYKVTQLIHGHVHKAGVHDHVLGNGMGVGKRYVLGDWHEIGVYLKLDGEGLELEQYGE